MDGIVEDAKRDIHSFMDVSWAKKVLYLLSVLKFANSIIIVLLLYEPL